MGATGAVRSLHMAVKFDADVSAADEANKRFSDMKGYGDKAAASVNKVEREMIEYAQKIGLTKNQLDALAKTKVKNDQIAGFSKQFGFAAADVKKLSDESEQAAGKLGKVGVAFKAIAASLVLAGAISFMGGMVKSAAQAEQTSISFEVMLGSAEKAKATLKDLKAFSDVTPFSSDKVIESGRALIAYGVKPGEQLNKTLQMVGDVAAGVGMDFGELSNIVGKNLTQGVVQTEDLMQLAGRGVPIFDSMAKVFNTTTDQVKNLASTGQIKFEHLQKAFGQMTGSGGMYFGMMDKLGHSAIGLWSTFESKTDEMKKSLGEMLLVALKPILEEGIKFVSWLNSCPEAMAVVKVALLILVPIIGVLMVAALTAAAVAAWAFVAPFLPIIAIAALIIGAIIGIVLVIQDIYTCLTGGEGIFSDWINTIKSVVNKVIAFFKAIPEAVVSFFKSIPGRLKGLIVKYAEWSASVNEKIIGFFKSIPGKIVDFIKSIPGKLKGLIKDYQEWSRSVGETILNFIKSIPDRIVEFFKSIPGRLKRLLSGIIPDWLMRKLGGSETPPQTGDAGNPPEHRAFGGPVYAGQEYEVGEDGPERFRPRTDGYIIPHGGSGSAGSVVFAPVINISVGSGDPNAIAKTVKDVLYTLFNDSRASLGLQEG